MDYAGDISPTRCWEMATGEEAATIVDVRTSAEWAYVGSPLLPEGGSALIGQEWQIFPAMAVDPAFADKLEAQFSPLGVDRNSPICFLCRSGVRSLAAARAMTERGYKKAYNIAGGFEGDPDQDGHRGNINGWKAEGLPWRQR